MSSPAGPETRGAASRPVADDGAVHDDAVLAVAATHRVGALRSDQWPMVAAHLVAAGFAGADLLTLACLPAAPSGWEVDQLVPGALREIAAPELDAGRAGEVYARVLALAGSKDQDRPIVRGLAELAAPLGYPTGVIRDAYVVSEWLDCACHEGAPERAEADVLEARFAALPALDLPDGLADTLLP
jgi:hypothetical protein